jgi:hypothetical protein
MFSTSSIKTSMFLSFERMGYLVQQGLEGVMVAAVDQGHIDGHVRQRLSGAQAGETSSDYHHPGMRRDMLYHGRRWGRDYGILSHSDTLLGTHTRMLSLLGYRPGMKSYARG